MKNETRPLIFAAVLLMAAGSTQAQTVTPGGTGAAASGLMAVPRTNTINPEVAPPASPSGSLNPEVHVPSVPTVQTPAVPTIPTNDPNVVLPSVPLINDSLNPTGAVPSVPVPDPSQETVDPNPQSQVSGSIGTPLPGQTPPEPTAGGQPAANVQSGMHAPALGPKTGGAAQVK